ncbi:cell division transport system permease protein [Microbacteriaceae bacterium SG_E_30_P1]|uniref:Cell division protein FtsX n=1 Tax=Antiquaquibacter oligotrophicus TaxID=2880260 RepID=A0ABT6KKT6_9MICO|nr:permease-like cell division protein FtsX [Antiquaquibacter oligotrophicus]MDH6180484.1 cell division transport system permease protein [Antiquaquibacter oligotrophicus]UDF13779.1 permease-like cell division protein FtsX [Antiquaquibacter oligotrophicus]
MRVGLILGEVANGLRRNVSMVISVVLVTFISLTFVGAAILLQMQIGQMKGYWYDRAQVAVYMCTDVDTTGNCTQTAATDAQIAAVQDQLDGPALSPYIERYEFETHEQAYENFQNQFADSPIAAFVTPETLNESFRVNLINPADADILIESLSGSAGVQNVEDQRGYLDQIFSVLNAASYTAIGVAALMLIAAVLLIATTIRLSAFSRRRELGIMRLVGASNRFIQTPFILEGVFAALIGSLLAGGAIVAIVQFFVQGYLQSTLQATTTLVGVSDAAIVVPILVIVGAALAAASAGVAISRYLKV